MRKLFLMAALTLALPIVALAQESPRTEIFAGYSYLRLDDDFNDDRDFNGWTVSVNQTIFKKYFGIKADVSGYQGNTMLGLTPRTDLNKFLFLIGPQLTLRKSEMFQPFAHVLVGAARITVDNDTLGVNFEDTGFALAVGGGLDVKALSSKLSVRLFQADYVLTRFDNAVGDTVNSNNFRASAGIVLRLGSVE
jgi:Outer membrane protein beta-barrel domain